MINDISIIKLRVKLCQSKVVIFTKEQLMDMTREELLAYDGTDKTTKEWLRKRRYILHPAEFVEKYYDVDDTTVENASYKN